MKKIIGIQGIKGSYHHHVALDFFGKDIEINECMSFQELVLNLEKGICTDAVMAIENSIAGSIIPNYAFIDEHNIAICGEYYLPIHHCLMALGGQSIEEIKEVYSHPMALLQCKKFFRQYPHIKLVEDVDTAEVARRIQQKQLKGIAAIAGEKAAEIYELEVLASDIQTIKTNSTRFFILDKEASISENDVNKASLKMILDHQQGSLAAILNVLNNCKLNLTKIQSLPVIDKPWKYAFFIDVTFQDIQDYKKALSIMKIMATEMKVLGTYKNNK